MKKILSISILVATFFLGSGCEKELNSIGKSACESLPHTAAPAGISGNWASGYSSMTQIVDVYNGRYLGNAWQGGKFFKITNNGRNAEFYYMATSQYSQTATKAVGALAFDAGSDDMEGSFTFRPCGAHYKGWGSMIIDRDATDAELKNNLTAKYFYRMQGQWLRIQPGGPVSEYSSSFRIVN